MKKTYETPVVEKVEFQYQEQVVASSCEDYWVRKGQGSCQEGNEYLETIN